MYVVACTYESVAFINKTFATTTVDVWYVQIHMCTKGYFLMSLWCFRLTCLSGIPAFNLVHLLSHLHSQYFCMIIKPPGGKPRTFFTLLRVVGTEQAKKKYKCEVYHFQQNHLCSKVKHFCQTVSSFDFGTLITNTYFLHFLILLHKSPVWGSCFWGLHLSTKCLPCRAIAWALPGRSEIWNEGP